MAFEGCWSLCCHDKWEFWLWDSHTMKCVCFLALGCVLQVGGTNKWALGELRCSNEFIFVNGTCIFLVIPVILFWFQMASSSRGGETAMGSWAWGRSSLPKPVHRGWGPWRGSHWRKWLQEGPTALPCHSQELYLAGGWIMQGSSGSVMRKVGEDFTWPS